MTLIESIRKLAREQPYTVYGRPIRTSCKYTIKYVDGCFGLG
jgi:hypothetical protein